MQMPLLVLKGEHALCMRSGLCVCACTRALPGWQEPNEVYDLFLFCGGFLITKKGASLHMHVKQRRDAHRIC